MKTLRREGSAVWIRNEIETLVLVVVVVFTVKQVTSGAPQRILAVTQRALTVRKVRHSRGRTANTPRRSLQICINFPGRLTGASGFCPRLPRFSEVPPGFSSCHDQDRCDVSAWWRVKQSNVL